MKGIDNRIAAASWRPGTVSKSEFSFSEGTPGEESVVARYKADRPIRLRDDEDSELRLTVPAYESFTTDGTGGNTETFNLSNDIIDSPATVPLVLFEEGSQVQADAVDYANNSFDYTDDGTGNTLDVFYIPADPASATIRKAAPGAGGTTTQTLKETQTKILHARDQAENEIRFSFNRTPYQGYVARKFRVELVVEAPYTAAFEAPERTNGTPEARNALLSLPRRQTESRIKGLGDAVKKDMVGL